MDTPAEHPNFRPCPGHCGKAGTVSDLSPPGTFCEECQDQLAERGIEPGWLVMELEQAEQVRKTTLATEALERTTHSSPSPRS